MIAVQLTEQQSALRQLAHEFAATEIRPVALALDREHRPEDRIPWALLKRGSQLGFRTFVLSVEHGGGGISDSLSRNVVLEELAWGDVGYAYYFAATAGHAHVWFDLTMTPSQRERYLPEFLADDLYHLGLGMHEPDSDTGYDYFVESIPNTGMKTTAARDSDGRWVINGVKNFQTNGSAIKLLLVLVRTEEGPGAILVPTDTPGVTRKEIDKVGRRLGSNDFYYFENVRVPGDNAFPKGFEIGAGRGGSGAVGAMNLGLGRAAFEAAVEFTQQRVQGGKPIIQHQAVGMALADMAIGLEAARSFVYRAAWAADHPDAVADGTVPNLPYDAMCRVFTAEVVHRAAVQAVELFGGMGIVMDLPVQKYVRDALVQLHVSFPTISRLQIGEFIAGFRRVKHPGLRLV